jgi:UDP-N-acetylmuramate dehydrogenase
MSAYVPQGILRAQEPMSCHVSWRAGGVARACYVPKDSNDLADFVATRTASERLHVVGLGSNLLVRDGGLDATVVLTHGALRRLKVLNHKDDLTLEVEAGVPAPKVARQAARLGAAGAEFLAGIPGTMGGALAMNAGCYGSETWEFVTSVVTLDRMGQLRLRTPADYEIGYRHVELKGSLKGSDPMRGLTPSIPLEPSPEWFISARLTFPRGDSTAALQRIRELLSRRVASQPLGEPNAGSVFRNPEGAYAAQLIEGCGLKGEREGGAEVSRKHANFIVNRGGATALDIETLMQRVQSRVLQDKGVALVTEVRIVGNNA